MKRVLLKEIPYRTEILVCGLLWIFAFSLRLFFLYTIDIPFVFYKYPDFAAKMLQGIDIGERILDLSPLYLYFMTVMTKYWNGDFIYTKFLQILVGAGNCVLIYLLGRRLFHGKIAVISALMYAVLGNIIVLETTLEPFVFVLFLGLLSINCLDRFRENTLSNRRTYGYTLLSGLFTGFAVITKPNYVLFLPIATVWLLHVARGQRSWRQRMGILAMFLGVTAIVISPVTIRNYVRFHDIVLVTADYGKVFFHGNGPNATGFLAASLPNQENWQEPDSAHVTFRQVATEQTGKPLLPSETSRFWVKVTLQEIFAHPVDHLLLELKKAHLFFHHYEMHLVGAAFVKHKRALAYPFLPYGIISSLAIYGMILGLKRFRTLFLLYGAVCLHFVSCLIFYVTSRYRSPAVPYLCLFAGYALYSLGQFAIQKHFKKLAYGSLGIALLLAVNYLPYKQEIEHVEPIMKKFFTETLQQWNTQLPDKDTISEQ